MMAAGETPGWAGTAPGQVMPSIACWCAALRGGQLPAPQTECLGLCLCQQSECLKMSGGLVIL